MKNNKAAGKDEILAEMLKEGETVIMPILKTLLNACLNKSEIPRYWKKSMFKKGNKNDIRTYRPIALLSPTA